MNLIASQCPMKVSVILSMKHSTYKEALEEETLLRAME